MPLDKKLLQESINQVTSAEVEPSKYREAINTTLAQEAVKFNAASYLVDPVQARKEYSQAKQLNVNPNLVKYLEPSKPNYNDIIKKAPSLSAALTNENLAPIVADDIEGLSYWDRWVSDLKQRPAIVENTRERADLGFKYLVGSDITLDDQEKENELKKFQEKDYNIGFVAGLPAGIVEGAYNLAQMGKNVTIPTVGGAVVGGVIGNIPGAIAGGKLAYDVSSLGDAFYVEAGNAMLDLKDVSQGYGDDLEVARGGAVVVGATNMVLEKFALDKLLSKLPGMDKVFSKTGKEFVKEQIKKESTREIYKRLGKAVASGMTTEGITEGLQEIPNILSEELVRFKSSGFKEGFGITESTTPETAYENFTQWLADSVERVGVAAQKGAQIGGGLGGAFQGINEASRAYSQHRQYKKEQALLTEAVNQAKTNKTFSESKEAWLDITQENLGKETIYAPANKVKELFQSENGEALYNELTTLIPEIKEQLEDAVKANGDLVLPANKVIAALASNDAYTSFQEFLRYTPESLDNTQYDEEILNRVYNDVVTEEGNIIDPVTEIEKKLEIQLFNAGNTPNQVKQVMSLISANLRSDLANQTDPEVINEIKSQYENLSIQAINNKVKDYTDEYIEMIRGANKPQKPTYPLIDKLRKMGGVAKDSVLASELLASGLDPKKIKGVIKDKGKISDIDNLPAVEFKDEFGLENVPEENGYVDRQFILDSLKSEIEGSPLQSATMQSQNAAIYDFKRNLEEMGLDINKLSNEEIKAALAKDSQRQFGVVELEQDGINVDSEAFKKWFGNSKVVDENGKPLIVYHGTTNDFDLFDAVRTGGVGFYFSKYPEEANQYAKRKRLAPSDEPQAVENVIPAYLSIQNPATAAQYNAALDKSSGGNPRRQAIDILKKEGFDGIIFSKDATGGLTNSGQIIVFEPTQIKSVFNKGTFDPSDPRILYQSAPTFYSALENSISEIQLNKGTKEQWQGIIKNLTQKGVKQEEIDYIGVIDWLNEQEGQVTKQQVLDYVNANKLEVQEVVKGAGTQVDKGYRAFVQKMVDKYGEQDWIYNMTPSEEAEKERLFNAETIDDTKYSKYTLEGGEDYKELLITLPNALEIEYDKLEKQFLSLPKNSEERLKLKERLAEISQKIGEEKLIGKEQYQSSHYDEKNILSTLRFKTRTDADGKKIMFIEEIQSDWHQEGRKKGYKTKKEEQEQKELRKKYDDLTRELGNLRRKLAYDLPSFDNLGFNFPSAAINAIRNNEDFATRWNIEDKELLETANKYREAYKAKIEIEPKIRENALVPDAPFKTSWPELSFKRAMLWAVENGFDKIAWTTGEQQADRYDLRKDVESINVEPRDNKRLVYIVDKANRDLTIEFDSKGKVVNSTVGYLTAGTDISDVVGKELAEKIMNVKEETTLRDIDLKMGGEGMKGFYDKMLPSMVNKLAKKFGGKVEKSSFTVEKEEVNTNSLEITPAMRDAIQQRGLPLFQGEDTKRGSIQFLPSGQSVISLFEGAKDLSTILHELGHFFLERRKNLINKFGDRVANKKDYDETFTWFEKNIKDIYRDALKINSTAIADAGGEEFVLQRIKAQGIELKGDNSANDAVAIAMHEYFARGFEAYLMKGEAPSIGLRDAFRNFKAWLLRIYKSLANLGVKLDSNIQDIFDRMLATEEQINIVKNRTLFKPDAEIAKLLTKAELNDYIKRNDNQIKTAEEKLLKKLLKDKAKKEKDWYKQERAKVENEILESLQASPLYKLVHYFKTGTDFDGKEYNLEHLKLDRKDIKARFPQLYKRLPSFVFGDKNFIAPELIAEMFGYNSATAMLNVVSNAPDIKSELRRITESTMLERFGDSLKDGSIEREAIEAMQNNDRASKIEYELQVINRKANIEKIAFKEQTRLMAIEILAKRKIGVSLNVNSYYAGEVNSARESGKALARKDYKKAAEYKAAQLLNHYLYREALNLQKEKVKAENLFKKIYKPDSKLANTRNIELVIAARALLSKFGYTRTKQDPMVALERIKKIDPDLYEDLKTAVNVAGLPTKKMADLTFEEFKMLNDAILNLWELSRREKQIEIEGKLIDKRKVVEELKESIFKNLSDKKQKKYNSASTAWDKTKIALLSLKSSLRRVESWIDTIEGLEGSFGKYIFNPVVEAINLYRKEKKEYLIKFRALLESVDLSGGEILAPELTDREGTPFKFNNKQELLHAILHTGNQSNKRKLLLGYGWASSNLDGTLNTSKWDKFVSRLQKENILTKADYDFIQGVWDLFEEMKPKAWEAHKKMYGFYPPEVTAQPFNTMFGEYQGGYAPAIADPFVVQDASIKQEIETIEQGGNSSEMFPSVGKGFTQGRIESYTKPLALNLQLLPAHIDKVTRFANIGNIVKDVGRIFKDRDFQDTLFKLDKTILQDMLLPWLQRVASQSIETPVKGIGGRWLAKKANALRKRSGMLIMFGNLTNALQQITGFSLAALKIELKYLTPALWQYIRNPSIIMRDVREKSTFMSNRTDGQMFEVTKEINDFILNPTKYDKIKDFTDKHAYFLQTGFQNFVDGIVWVAAYNRAVENNKTEKQAVREADSVVRQTQGTFNPEDISRFEGGNAFLRLFLQFYSYFNMQANAVGSEVVKTIRDLGFTRKGNARLFYIYVTGIMLPMVVAEVIVKAMSGEDFDSEDDGYLDDVLALFFGSQIRGVAAGVPIFGQLATYAINLKNDKPYDDRISTSPVVSMFESSVRGGIKLSEVVASEEITPRDIKDITTAIGMISGIPVTPLGKAISYGVAVEQGRADPENAVDYTRGLLTGKQGN